MSKKAPPSIAEMRTELMRKEMWLSTARAKSSRTKYRNHDGKRCATQSNNGIITERRQLIKTLAHTKNDDAAEKIGYKIARCETRNKCRHLLCCFCRAEVQGDYAWRMRAFAKKYNPSKVYRLTVIIAAWSQLEINTAAQTSKPGEMIFDEWSSFKRHFRYWSTKSLPDTKVMLAAELEWHRVENNPRSKINQTLTQMGYKVGDECMVLHAHGIVAFDTGIDPEKRQRMDRYLQLRARKAVKQRFKLTKVPDQISHLTRWDTRSGETLTKHTLSTWMRYALKGRISKAKDNWRGDAAGRARFFYEDANGRLIWDVQADWATVEMAKVYAFMPGGKKLVLQIGKL